MQQNTDQENQSVTMRSYGMHTTSSVHHDDLQSWNSMDEYIPGNVTPRNKYSTMQAPEAFAFHTTALIAGANSYATTQSPMQSTSADANMTHLGRDFSTTSSFVSDNLHATHSWNGYHSFNHIPGYTSADFGPLRSVGSSSFGSSTASDPDMTMNPVMGSDPLSQYSWPATAMSGAYSALSDSTHLILGTAGYPVGGEDYAHLPSNLHDSPTSPTMMVLGSQRVHGSEMRFGGQMIGNSHLSCILPSTASMKLSTSEYCYDQPVRSPSNTAFGSLASSASEEYEMFKLSPKSWSKASPLLVTKNEPVSPTASLLDYSTNLQDPSAANDDFFKSSASSPALTSRTSPAQFMSPASNTSPQSRAEADSILAAANPASTQITNRPNPSLSDAEWLGRLKPEDRLLVEGRRIGLTYSQIKRNGQFEEQESSLRGRYRTLTKPKKERVRKPAWKTLDLQLLQTAVRIGLLQNTARNRDGSPRAVRNRISWKEVSEYISDHGGSYHFGVSTCKKMYEQIYGPL